MRPVDAFGAAVEGHGTSSGPGQGLQRLRDPGHDQLCGAAIPGTDELADRFLADPQRRGFKPNPARDLFGASRYVLVKYKVSKGNCHEFYAVDAQGTVVEAYMHPVTGETIRSTRIPADAAPAARTPTRR